MKLPKEIMYNTTRFTTPCEKLVYLSLHMLLGEGPDVGDEEDEVPIISKSSIAEMCRCSEEEVHEALVNLDKTGLIIYGDGEFELLRYPYWLDQQLPY